MPLPAPTLTVAADPARGAVRIVVGIPPGATTVTLGRTSTRTGNYAGVRGAINRDVTGLSELLVYDFEAPAGVELVYSATVGPDTSPAGTAAPITVVDLRDWLVDLARPTNSFPVQVEGLPELKFDAPVGIHRVLERRDPVLTTSTLFTPTGQLRVITATQSERDRARAILGAGVTVLLRTPPERGVGNIYLGVLGMVEQRPSRIATHAFRRFNVDVVQVARPDPELFVPAPPLTYRRLLELWPTYRDVLDLGVSYQELAYADPATGGGPASPGGLPWLPDDI